MADKEATERRVYVLPTEQLERIRAYQTANGIASEVEAVRRLLDIGLQLRDNIFDILRTLKSRYSSDKDLRILAKDILAPHTLVKSVHFDNDSVWFYMTDGEGGKIDRHGLTYRQRPDQQADEWQPWPRPTTASTVPSWDAPKGDDLDDEIPF
jgi:hypothetical protein